MKKTFIFETYISYNYESHKADCLNGSEHEYELVTGIPKELSIMECKFCGHEKQLTEDERKKYNIGSIEDYINKLYDDAI